MIVRSFIFVSTHSEKMMKKAQAFPTDGIILDLEDAVSPEEKENSRESLRNLFNELDYGHRHVFIRINGFDTPWGREDAIVVANLHPDAVVIPKVKDYRDLEMAHEILGDIPLVAMVETPQAILNLKNIAQCRKLIGFFFGAADLTGELNMELTRLREELIYFMSATVTVARIHNLFVLDTPAFDLNDMDALEKQARFARIMGFDGKTAIHPSQLEVINKIFSPSDEEIEWAKMVKEVFEKAISQGRGVTTLDGKMIERIHYKRALKILEYAKEIQKRGY